MPKQDNKGRKVGALAFLATKSQKSTFPVLKAFGCWQRFFCVSVDVKGKHHVTWVRKHIRLASVWVQCVKNLHKSPVQAGPVGIEHESNVDGLGPVKYAGPMQAGPVGIVCESNGGGLGSAKITGPCHLRIT
jgi:hypothetical protein